MYFHWSVLLKGRFKFLYHISSIKSPLVKESYRGLIHLYRETVKIKSDFYYVQAEGLIQILFFYELSFLNLRRQKVLEANLSEAKENIKIQREKTLTENLTFPVHSTPFQIEK